MKPAPFEYHAPESVGACVQLLQEHAFDAALLSGGQSLIPLMRFRLAQPEHVISIRNVFIDMPGISCTDHSVIIRAGVTYAEIVRNAEIQRLLPQLIRTLDLVAYPGIRTRGTLIGNLCHADPASELPALTLLLEAKFKCVSASGERIVPAKEFFQGPYMTACQDNELVVEIEIPLPANETSFAINEVTRLRGGFPMAGVAVSFTGTKGGPCRDAAIACFGVHSHQIRLPDAEAALNGLGLTSEGILAAVEAFEHHIKPHADPYASVSYRRRALRALFIRSIDEASEGGLAT